MRRASTSQQGIAQFNRGQYFERHETLELLWRKERRDVRRRHRRGAGAALTEVERLGPNRLGEFDWQLAPTVHLRA